ncbi:MAG TPA: MFS transporter [Bacillales bacterium]|nr:MFS transporter [Bacillales bacterium]
MIINGQNEVGDHVGNKGQKFTDKEMYTFAEGDAFGGGGTNYYSPFYLTLLTNAVQIGPFRAGLDILPSMAWDVASDPLMDIITDNTRTKWGKRRPYFFIGSFEEGLLIIDPMMSSSKTSLTRF